MRRDNSVNCFTQITLVMSNSAKKSSPSRSKATQPVAAASERKPALSIIRDIQRQTRRQYSAEEKIRIVLEGLQGEQSVAEICRREGLNTNIYYRWIGPPKRPLKGGVTGGRAISECRGCTYENLRLHRDLL